MTKAEQHFEHHKKVYLSHIFPPTEEDLFNCHGAKLLNRLISWISEKPNEGNYAESLRIRYITLSLQIKENENNAFLVQGLIEEQEQINAEIVAFAHKCFKLRAAEEKEAAIFERKMKKLIPNMEPHKHPLYEICRHLKACGDNGPKLQKIIEDNKVLFMDAKGSQHNHQAWDGGYLQHIYDCLAIALIIIKNNYDSTWKVPFSWASVVTVIFLHDIEKPFMQARMAADPQMPLWTNRQRNRFRSEIVKDYDIELTDEELNALLFIHGEGEDYHSDKRVMNELAALCHATDVLSSRLWHSRNKPEDNEK